MKTSNLFPDRHGTAQRHAALVRGSFRERYLPFAVAALVLLVALVALILGLGVVPKPLLSVTEPESAALVTVEASGR